MPISKQAFREQHESTLVSIQRMNQMLLSDPKKGENICQGVRKVQQGNITCFLVEANAQKDISYETATKTMANHIGLKGDETQTWWIGGDLTGFFPQKHTQKAVDTVRTFLDEHFKDKETGCYRKDRMLVSEYAGPEDKDGEQICAIRAIGKILEKDPELASSFVPYVVTDNEATKWFESIGAIIHPNIKHLYMVHGRREESTDPWDSNGLARNAFILEGGARTLGYMFEVLGAEGQVIGIYGLRDDDNPFMSSSRFLANLKEFLIKEPNANKDDIDRFWNAYIKVHPPFDPSTSDAHTKQYFLDKAWEYFYANDIKQKIIDNFVAHDAHSYVEAQGLIARMPKAELHVHIDGTLEPELMFKIAQRNKGLGVNFPYQSIEEVREKYQFEELKDFLNLYFLGAGVLRTEQDFYDLTYDYLKKAHENSVVRAEMFLGPQTHLWKAEVTMEVLMNGTLRAMKQAEKDFGISSGLIVDFDRSFVKDKSIIGTESWQETAKHEAPEDAIKTYHLVQEYFKKHEDDKKYLLGVGLDYAEDGFPPEWFKEVFTKAKEDGLMTVAHAGEEGPAEYVRQALDDLQVSRIDHGNSSVDDPNLLERLKSKKTPLTMCPLSNIALKVIHHISAHPVKRLYAQGIKVTLNSDDPAYFGGYINANYLAAARALGLSIYELADIAKNSIDASLMEDIRKAEYFEQIDSQLRKLECREAALKRIPSAHMLDSFFSQRQQAVPTI